MGEAETGRDRIFSVATGLAQGWPILGHDLGLWVATEAGAAAHNARDRPAVHSSAQCVCD